MAEMQDASSPIAWPPIIFGLAFGVAGLLTFLVPLPFALGLPSWLLQIAGGLLVVLAIGIVKLAADVFRQAGTPVLPTRRTTAFVAGGIYRYSRNPMYLAQVPLLLGIGLVGGSLWFVLAVPCAVFALQHLAIAREEIYLERQFGATYVKYKSHVRRWL